MAEGRTREARVVDHIVPLAHGGTDSDENTRNLCDPHHRLVTVEQFGFAASTIARGVDQAGRPTGRDHAWNRRPTAPAPAGPRRRPTPPGGSKV